MTVGVLTAAAGAGWEAAWVEAATGDAPVTITRRCVDVVDLLALAGAGHGRAALVAAALRRFDADAVDRLRAAGVIPVGVVPRGQEEAELRMRALGVEFLVPEDAEPAVVWSVVLEAVRASERSAEAGRGFADPWLSTSPATASGGAGVEAGRDGGTAATTAGGVAGDGEDGSAGAPEPGFVIAVWGPTGAPGRTTVAMCLADEVARLGASALLVDADVYGGTVAPAVGFLDESPGLAAACRTAGRTRLDATALARLCWQARPRLRVLTGIPMAARWPDLRTSAIPAVLAAARTLASCTVVDCGFSIETDEEVSYDSLAPRRNGATLAVLDNADLVLAVGSADPIGIQRLIRGLGELRDAEVRTTTRVVLNRVRRGAVPGDPSLELTRALTQFADVTPVGLLPHDLDAVDAALANGRFIAEVKPNSSLRKAVRELALAVAAPVLPAVVAPRRSRRHALLAVDRDAPAAR
jgi:MinD-like ATPase involved in chromosome partitioning or flagellar assembly